MAKLTTYSVTLSEDIIDFLSAYKQEKKSKYTMPRFSMFAELVKRTFLLNLQGKDTGLEYSELLKESGWSRPYLNNFLETLKTYSALTETKVGNKRIIKIRPEMVSDLNEIVSGDKLHVENDSKPSDPSQIVSVAKESGEALSEKDEN